MIQTRIVKDMKQMLSETKKILAIFTDVLLISIVLYLGVAIIFNNTNKLPLQFRVVLSDSMSEVFPSKSVILVKKVNLDRLREGDIISYQSNSDVVSHRIVELTENYFVTKGDSNQNNDNEPVYKYQIIGKVIGHMKYIGSFFLRIQSRIGKIALILTIIDFWVLKLFLQILLGKEPLKKELDYESAT